MQTSYTLMVMICKIEYIINKQVKLIENLGNHSTKIYLIFKVDKIILIFLKS